MMTGQLDQRVSVERLQSGQNEYVEPCQRLHYLVHHLGRCGASERPGILRRPCGTVSQVTTRIKLRYRPGITSADPVIHDGTTYNIQLVINYKSAKRELVLMCVG